MTKGRFVGQDQYLRRGASEEARLNSIGFSFTTTYIVFMNILFHAHSGIRYLVLLIGIIALAVYVYGMITKKPSGAARSLTAAFVGVVDLQVLLGLILLIFWQFYGALIGHITLMVLAAVAAHGTSIMARKSDDVAKANTIRLGGVLLTLVLIVLGILAIGRPIF